MNGKPILRTFKLSEKENEQLKADAHDHNMNVSEYIRWLINRESTLCSTRRVRRERVKANAAIDESIRELNEMYKDGKITYARWEELHDIISASYQ